MKEITFGIQYSCALYWPFTSLCCYFHLLTSALCSPLLQAEMRCHGPTRHFDVVWSKCWPGLDAVTDKYKLEKKETAAQGRMGGWLENVFFFVVLEMRQGTWVMNLNKCDWVFITQWLHWRYSLSTVALLLKHSNQSSPSPEGRPFLKYIKHNNSSWFLPWSYFIIYESWEPSDLVFCAASVSYNTPSRIQSVWTIQRPKALWASFCTSELLPEVHVLFFSCCGRRFWSLGLPRTKTKSVCKHTRR